jgi:hypothetical protein
MRVVKTVDEILEEAKKVGLVRVLVTGINQNGQAHFMTSDLNTLELCHISRSLDAWVADIVTGKIPWGQPK